MLRRMSCFSRKYKKAGVRLHFKGFGLKVGMLSTYRGLTKFSTYAAEIDFNHRRNRSAVAYKGM